MTNASDPARRLYDVIRLIRPAHRRLARSVAALLEGSGISVGGRAVLELLREAGAPGLSVPDTARRLVLARQQVQLVMDALERDGLVARRPNPAHRRSPLFALTGEGQGIFARLHALELEQLAGIAASLSPEDLTSALKVMDALVSGFAAYEDTSDRPAPLA